jgi:hypothetical protein
MTHIWQGLRSGRWLTPARIRGYSLILLGICAIAIVGCVAVSDGLIDRNGKPLGTDFSNVYAAGTLTWQGHPSEAYVPALQHAAEKASFGGREVPFYGWHYPPFFFAVAFVVAAFPYAGACRSGLRQVSPPTWRSCARSCHGPRRCWSQPPSPPSSSTSATVRTDF